MERWVGCHWVKLLDGSEFHNNKNKPYERNNYRTWFTGSYTTISPREADNSEWYLHTTEAENTGADFEDTPTYHEMIREGSNYFPLNAAWDYFINTTDTSSHANGPEHSVVFCNEIIKQEDGSQAAGFPGIKTCRYAASRSQTLRSGRVLTICLPG